VSWHAGPELLERYARLQLDDVAAASLEAHLMACSECRAHLSGAVPGARVERIWQDVAAALDAPRPGLVEKVLIRLGVSDAVARLLAATPSLRLSWFLAVAAALAFSVTAAYAGTTGILLFLLVSPLLPVAGVAAAYGPGIDPTYEVGLTAPMRTFRLLMVRATAVLVSSTVLAGLAALALPHLDWRAAAWLLPSAGLSAASLALATVWSPLVSSAALAAAWIGIAVYAETAAQVPLAAFRAGGQIVFALLLAGSIVVVARRRERFDMRRDR
jgi:hypothetical protein